MVKDFRHACIVVKDLEKSIRFYRDLLGLKVSKRRTVEGAYPETAFKLKEARLTYVKMRGRAKPPGSTPLFELHYWEKPKRLPKSTYNHISFTVSNLDSEFARLSKLKVKFISGPVQSPYDNTKICFALDPDGNLIEFVEE